MFFKILYAKCRKKCFNALIDDKRYFDVPIKNQEETCDRERFIERSKSNDYTTGNLLDYDYFSKHYKLIAIDLSMQIELGNPDLKQQVNFSGKIEEDDGAAMFFITEKSEETIFNFSQNSVSII